MKTETTETNNREIDRPRTVPKNIVLCSDGTGNRGGKGRGTNVWKLFNAVDIHGHESRVNDTVQIAFYDDGVGTEDFKLFKVLGGAVGWGLSRNVKDLYRHLVTAYEPGDNIYLFGFSRGAFTVRALAGLICRCGIVDRCKCSSDDEVRKRIDEAFKAYRLVAKKPSGTDHFKKDHGVKVSQIQGIPYDVPIRFLGVWDTVDAVGLPIDELVDALDFVLKWLAPSVRFRFENKALHPLVEKACHAVAIDDERHTFHPVLWDENYSQKLADEYYMKQGLNPPDPEKRIEQVWFSGVHSNVGGGYPKDQMARVTLQWMMSKAEEAKLRFIAQNRQEIDDEANVHGKLYDSRSGLGAYYRYKPRNLLDLRQKYRLKYDGKPAPIHIHGSVLQRIACCTDEYAPAHIPETYQVDALGTQGSGIPLEELNPKERHLKLEGVQFWIHCRRVLYYAFLVWTLAFLVWTVDIFVKTARLPDPTVGAELKETWRLLEWLLDLAKLLAPAFLDMWINGLQNAPGWFMGFLIALLCLVGLRVYFKHKTRSVCQEAWRCSFPLKSVFWGSRLSKEN